MQKINRKQKLAVYRVGRTSTKVVSIFGRLLLCLIFTFPFYWMLITSVKTYRESIMFPPTLWPKVLDWNGFHTVLEGMNIGMYFKNSVIIILAIMILQVVTTVPAAYAFARYDFKGKGLLFTLVLIAYMTPVVITFIPVYIMFANVAVGDFKLLNTLWPQILPFGADAFGIFLLRQNIMQIPEEIIESAKLDNAGEIKIMFKVVLPMCKSTFATIVLFSFVNHWNAYFWPLVMARKEELKTVVLAIASLKELDSGIVWPTVMAGNVLIILPIVVLFIIMSKQIISAMAYRGVK